MTVDIDQLARSVLVDTLHGPVPMKTTALLAQRVLELRDKVATLEKAICDGLFVSIGSGDSEGVRCLCCGSKWLDTEDDTHTNDCPLHTDWQPGLSKVKLWGS